MTLARIAPLFTELNATKDRLNRLFGGDEVWGREEALPAAEWMPAVDILEGENEIVIKAELPGMEAKDVEVDIDNNVLTLKGERRLEKDTKKDNYHRMERTYGMFRRAFTLPAFVDAGNIRAEFKNGLLTIMLPKKEAAKGRSIEVKAA